MAAEASISMLYPPIADVYQALRGEPLQGDGDELKGYCLVVGHADHNPSCSYSISHDVWRCFSCDSGGGVFDLILASGVVENKAGVRKWLKEQKLVEDRIAPSTWDKAKAVYQYTDANGSLVYEAGKFVTSSGDKSFKLRSVLPNGKYGEQPGAMAKVQRVPYKLPLLLTAADKGLPVHVVEGEKDVESLTRHGLIATTNAGGSPFNWPLDWAQFFRGVEKVYVLADNDEAGRKCADKRAALIATVVPEVRVVYVMPGVGPKGDVTDWLEAGGDISNLRSICEAGELVTPYVPEYDSAALPGLVSDPSEYGASRWMTHHFGNLMRFIDDRNKWFAYKAGRWTNGCDGVLAVKSADLVMKAATDIGDEDLIKFAETLRTSTRTDSVLKIARRENHAESSVFDLHPHLLNVANGTLDLDTFTLRPHDPADMLTLKTSITYDPGADCPTFKNWLRDCVSGDAEMFMYMQQVLGSCLEARSGLRKLYFLIGPPGTGKSTFLRVAEHLLEEYQCGTDFSSLLESKFGSAPGSASPHLAALKGKRMVSASEARGNMLLDAAKIKQLVGGDVISARHLHGEIFQFRFDATLILAGNELPRICADESLWSKLAIVPFYNEIVAENPNFEKENLWPELSGILNFALEGLKMLHANGHKLSDPETVRKLRAEHMNEQDTVSQFASDCIEKIEVGDKLTHIKQSDVRSAYANWCSKRRFSMMSTAHVKKTLQGLGGELGSLRGCPTWKNLRIVLPDDGDEY